MKFLVISVSKAKYYRADLNSSKPTGRQYNFTLFMIEYIELRSSYVIKNKFVV